MKLWIAAAAFAAALFATPAAATTIVHIEASASGTTESLMCMTGPECLATDPFSAFFSRDIFLDAFVDGLARFQSGSSANAGIMSGTVRDLGSGMMTGLDFRFDQSRVCASTPCLNISTNLAAATFSVRQIFPSTTADTGALAQAVTSAVPEPGTWATMLIGFGAIGASLRRARRMRPLALAS